MYLFYSKSTYCIINSNIEHSIVKRVRLKYANVLSLNPQKWLSTLLNKSSHNKIKEIIVIPSLLCNIETLEYDYVLDDEHFCSRLCDSGYIVHIVDPFIKTSDQSSECNLINAIIETISWRVDTNKVSPRNIAVLCNELSSSKFLYYLSEVMIFIFNI